MRILVEPSDYVLRNVGDMAMLRTAVSRLATYWPNATIQVLSDEPDALLAFCPEATPLASTGRRRWLTNEFIPGRHNAPYLSRPLQALLRNRAPELVETFWRRRLRRQPSDLQALNEFAKAVSMADLIVVTGMGGITDAFSEYATDVLETLRLAVRRRKYVAMVGQGFGPLRNPRLVARARSVLPRVNFIGLREERASRPLLQSLGVASDRIMTTGDDAIEIAYISRCDRLGDDIGVNLRASDYSGVGHTLFEPLRKVLRIAANTRQVPLVPIPISFVPGEADAETIRHLIDGDNDQSQGASPLVTPEAVIHEIQRCRLVVTGSYHAGVFALASGIPTIGLAGSPYYIDKFQGLSALFGDGCQTVLLGDQDFAKNLETAIARLWEAAEHVRPWLLEEAARQIQLGHEAYRRIRAEIAGRN
jgi:colanic acid/amylovoran biosynthesis protein